MAEVGVGLQVGVIFHHDEQASQGAGQFRIALSQILRGARAGHLGAGVGQVVEDILLMGGVTLDRLHQVGDQIAAALQLGLYVALGQAHVFTPGYQPVIAPRGRCDHDHHDRRDDKQRNQ